MSKQKQIVLAIPPEAAYISLARLTASGLANQLGFDMDAIEDIKVCVSEVLNETISTSSDIKEPITLCFDLTKDGFEVLISRELLPQSALFTSETGQFALSILETLMDRVILSNDNAGTICLSKTTGRSVPHG